MYPSPTRQNAAKASGIPQNLTEIPGREGDQRIGSSVSRNNNGGTQRLCDSLANIKSSNTSKLSVTTSFNNRSPFNYPGPISPKTPGIIYPEVEGNQRSMPPKVQPKSEKRKFNDTGNVLGKPKLSDVERQEYFSNNHCNERSSEFRIMEVYDKTIDYLLDDCYENDMHGHIISEERIGYYDAIDRMLESGYGECNDDDSVENISISKLSNEFTAEVGRIKLLNKYPENIINSVVKELEFMGQDKFPAHIINDVLEYCLQEEVGKSKVDVPNQKEVTAQLEDSARKNKPMEYAQNSIGLPSKNNSKPSFRQELYRTPRLKKQQNMPHYSYKSAKPKNDNAIRECENNNRLSFYDDLKKNA